MSFIKLQYEVVLPVDDLGKEEVQSYFESSGKDEREMRKASWLRALSVVVSGMVYGYIAGEGSAAAATVDVTVDNIEYSVTDVTTSFLADEPTLENQPWWEQSGSAAAFASAVGGELGYQSVEGQTASPLFAIEENGDTIASAGTNGISLSGYITGNYYQTEYAVATVIPSSPEPEPLAGVVVAVGLGVALRCRRRTVTQKGE